MFLEGEIILVKDNFSWLDSRWKCSHSSVTHCIGSLRKPINYQDCSCVVEELREMVC